MEALRDSEVEDLTSGISSGLMSWLSFGSVSSLKATAMSGGVLETTETSKMETVLARTQAAVDFKREGGVNTSATDDTMTKRAEEQAVRVHKSTEK